MNQSAASADNNSEAFSMKSKEYVLSSQGSDNRNIPNEAESTALKNRLDEKSALRLRLLAEELICMLPQLLHYGAGKFWIEWTGRDYELHLNVTIDKAHGYDVDRILAVSSSGQNAAAKGIIGKMIVAVESMLGKNENSIDDDPYGVWRRGLADYDEETIWSLEAYKDAFSSENAKQEYSDDGDELERSIIANLADEVRVGVRGGKIDIVVLKSFYK